MGSLPVSGELPPFPQASRDGYEMQATPSPSRSNPRTQNMTDTKTSRANTQDHAPTVQLYRDGVPLSPERSQSGSSASYSLPEPGSIDVFYPVTAVDATTVGVSSSSSPHSLSTYANASSAHTSEIRAALKPLRLLQWNIERGYEMPEILRTLKEVNADVVALQEIDIGCKRSGEGNQAEQLAVALGMTCAFVCEFNEIEHSVRKDRDQGGGVHGNAILTRPHFATKFRKVDHRHHPYDWENDGIQLNEPRQGRRYTIVADIDPKNGFPPFQMYSAHLEIFCGLTGRVAQISDLLHDAATHPLTPIPRQALFGDLNTAAHGIARLSPKFCRDNFRWRTLGTAESTWIDRHVFAFHALEGAKNHLLEQYSDVHVFSDVVLRNARNPGFYDPWHPALDITLHSKNHFGLYEAKLDWTLLRGFDVIRQWMGNDDYTASDHKYLVVEVLPSAEPSESLDSAEMEVRYFHTLRDKFLRKRRRVLFDSDDYKDRKLRGRVRLYVGVAAAVVGIGIWVWNRKK